MFKPTFPRIERRAWFMALRASLLLACAAGALVALPAHADEDFAREQLARIAQEIRQVEAMTAQAAQSAQTAPPGRVRFRYDWLQRDLREVRQGIEQHLEGPRQPRPVAPLRGDYQQ